MFDVNAVLAERYQKLKEAGEAAKKHTNINSNQYKQYFWQEPDMRPMHLRGIGSEAPGTGSSAAPADAASADAAERQLAMRTNRRICCLPESSSKCCRRGMEECRECERLERRVVEGGQEKRNREDKGKGLKESSEDMSSSSDLEVDPGAIELVVLDIDSYEYQILDAIENSGTKVLMYYLEVSMQFPPPYKYAMTYHPTKTPQYREALKYDSNMFFSPLYGMSLSIILERLQETHFLLQLTSRTDAVFIHKSLKKNFERSFGISLPVDEFVCYRGSVLWHQMLQLNVRGWAFNEPIWEGLVHVNDNMTAYSPDIDEIEDTNSTCTHKKNVPPYILYV